MTTRVYWSDADDSLTRQSDGDVQRDNDVDAIFNSLTNIILTVQGERRMLPTFASNVTKLLFEPIDTHLMPCSKYPEFNPIEILSLPCLVDPEK